MKYLAGKLLDDGRIAYVRVEFCFDKPASVDVIFAAESLNSELEPEDGHSYLVDQRLGIGYSESEAMDEFDEIEGLEFKLPESGMIDENEMQALIDKARLNHSLKKQTSEKEANANRRKGGI